MVLLADLAEHQGCINALSVSRDNVFLASASDDGTVKIWSCQAFAAASNAMSSLTYAAQGGQITDVAVCDSSHSFASSSSSGSVHVVRLDYASRADVTDDDPVRI